MSKCHLKITKCMKNNNEESIIKKPIKKMILPFSNNTLGKFVGHYCCHATTERHYIFLPPLKLFPQKYYNLLVFIMYLSFPRATAIFH